MTAELSHERRAQQLVRCYPRPWRERYGEEYAQLLVDELAGDGLPLSRRLDVLGHALWTRLVYTGLAGEAISPARRKRVLFGALGAVGAVCAVLAIGLWSQLAVGLPWSAPTNSGTRAAVALMSAAVIGLGAVSMLLLVPVLAQLLGRLRAHAWAAEWRSLLSAATAGVVLYVGCRHFGPHWPGTGGHGWSARAFVPTQVARLGWAATLWMSAYWAHPVALRTFPTSEVAWMLISPAAWIVLGSSGLALIRRVGLSAGLVRWAVAMFRAGAVVLGTFLVGAVLWVFSGGSGPGSLFAAGLLDGVIVSVLGCGLIAGTHLTRRAGAATLLAEDG